MWGSRRDGLSSWLTSCGAEGFNPHCAFVKLYRYRTLDERVEDSTGWLSGRNVRGGLATTSLATSPGRRPVAPAVQALSSSQSIHGALKRAIQACLSG